MTGHVNYSTRCSVVQLVYALGEHTDLAPAVRPFSAGPVLSFPQQVVASTRVPLHVNIIIIVEHIGATSPGHTG